jgi:hypothetical protein
MMTFITTLKELAVGATCFLVLFGIVFSAYAPVLEAIIAIDPSDIAFDIYSAIYNTWTWISNNWMELKEQYLDGVVWVIINTMLQQMIQSVTQWVNNGFEGQPAFLQNPSVFLTGVADRVVNHYLDGTELGNFLCSPFSIDVRFALSLSYGASRNTAPRCTIGGIINNMQYSMQNFQNFINGAFSTQGGWPAWFQFTQNPQYNPYGALIMAEERLSVRIGNAKGQEFSMVQSAKGFLSTKRCENQPNVDTGEPEEHCSTVTPGSAIEDSLNENLKLGGRRIAVADEFNELIGALLTQLVTQVFQGGMTTSLGSGSGNFFTSSGLSANVPNGTQDPIGAAVSSETSYRNAIQAVLNRILAAENYKNDTYGPTTTDPITGDIVPNNCHTGELTPALIAKKNELTGLVNNSNLLIPGLITIKQKYDAAVAANNTTDQNAAMTEFLNVQGSVHHPPQVQVFNQVDGPEIDKLIAEFEQQVDAFCAVNRGGADAGTG